MQIQVASAGRAVGAGASLGGECAGVADSGHEVGVSVHGLTSTGRGEGASSGASGGKAVIR